MVSDIEEGEDEVVQSHAGGSDDDDEGEDLLENAHAWVSMPLSPIIESFALPNADTRCISLGKPSACTVPARSPDHAFSHR